MEQELKFGLNLGGMANFPAFIASKSFDLCSDAASGWAGFSPPGIWEFSSPYSNQGADCTHHSTVCPPGFENLAASLIILGFLFQILFGILLLNILFLFFRKKERIWVLGSFCHSRISIFCTLLSVYHMPFTAR